MREKWSAGKRGYLKMHVSVNARNKKILSMKVTDEHAHGGKALPELVYGITRPDRKTTACKLFADGAYGSNDVFGCLSDNGIHPCVKARKDARVRVKTGHILRLETCQFCRKEMILEIGKAAQAVDGRNSVFAH